MILLSKGFEHIPLDRDAVSEAKINLFDAGRKYKIEKIFIKESELCPAHFKFCARWKSQSYLINDYSRPDDNMIGEFVKMFNPKVMSGVFPYENTKFAGITSDKTGTVCVGLSYEDYMVFKDNPMFFDAKGLARNVGAIKSEEDEKLALSMGDYVVTHNYDFAVKAWSTGNHKVVYKNSNMKIVPRISQEESCRNTLSYLKD